MSRHGYSSHSSGVEAAAGGLLALAVVVAVMLLYYFIRSCVFIGKTLYRYYTHSRVLKIAVAVCLVLFLLGSVLTLVFHNQACEAIAFGGYAELLVCSTVVHRQNATCFMTAEGSSLTASILHRPWWADESTPLAA